MDDTVEPRASLLNWRVPLLTAGVPPPTPAVAFQAPLRPLRSPPRAPGRCLPPHTASGSPAIDADGSDNMAGKGRLADKVAVVTGAAPRGEGVGNGKAAALLFAREGAKVVLVNRSAERAGKLAAEIAEEGGRSEEQTAELQSLK